MLPIRKILYVLAVGFTVGFFMLSMPTEEAKAQKIGLGLMYGDRIQNVGGSMDAQFRFHQYFRFTGDFSVYLTKEFSDQRGKWNWWSVNTNLDFVFLDVGLFRSYVFTGVNYANLMRTFPTSGNRDVDSEIGLNVGGGLEYKTSFGSIYGQYQYTFIEEKFQQYEINTGVRFYLGGGR